MQLVTEQLSVTVTEENKSQKSLFAYG